MIVYNKLAFFFFFYSRTTGNHFKDDTENVNGFYSIFIMYGNFPMKVLVLIKIS